MARVGAVVIAPMARWSAASAIAWLAEQATCGREVSNVFVAATDRAWLQSHSALLRVLALP